MIGGGLSTLEQVALAEYMSDLSEYYLAAGWHIGVEYQLWASVVVLENPMAARGCLSLKPHEINTLMEMSWSLGGWVYWNKEHGETFVPIEEWKAVYAKYLKGEIV